MEMVWPTGPAQDTAGLSPSGALPPRGAHPCFDLLIPMPGENEGGGAKAQPATSIAASETSGYGSFMTTLPEIRPGKFRRAVLHPTTRNGTVNSGSICSLVDRTFPVAASKWTLKIRLLLTGI